MDYFRNMGNFTQQADIKHFHNSTEIALTGIGRLRNFPYLMRNDNKPPTIMENVKSLIESAVAPNRYTKEALIFELLRSSKAFMGTRNMAKYEYQTTLLKQEVLVRNERIKIYIQCMTCFSFFFCFFTEESSTLRWGALFSNSTRACHIPQQLYCYIMGH